MNERFTTLTESEFPQRVVENAAGVRAVVLANGSLSTLSVGPTLVNLFVGPPIGRGATQLWLRQHRDGRIVDAVNGLGNAVTERGVIERGLRWAGSFAETRYEIDLVLHPEEAAWAWSVRWFADGREAAAGGYDAVLVQDLGLAGRGQVQNNEAYTSQYVDHRVLEHATFGPVLAARQNLAQDGRHPALLHACLPGAAGGLTDGFDFFGPSHRGDARPVAVADELPTRNRQYEFSCHALQSRPVALTASEPAECRFLACFTPDHPAATAIDDLKLLDAAASNLAWAQRTETREILDESAMVEAKPTPRAGKPLTPAELDGLFPGLHRHAESVDGELASFFHGDGRHTVTRHKELAADRRTAHLLMAGRERLPGGETLCSTGYAHGVFASHICLGNTTFNKLLAVSRDPLNLTQADGLRLSVWDAAGISWEPLGVASAFDMGVDDCVWVYQLDDHSRITVTAAADHASRSDSPESESPGPTLHWRVEIDGPPQRLRMTAHLALGDREHEHPGEVAVALDRSHVTLTPGDATMIRQRYPRASWTWAFDEPPADLGGDELLYGDGKRRGLPYLVAQTAAVKSWGWSIRGTLGPAAEGEDELDRRAESDRGAALPALEHPAEPVRRLAEALPWFEHNAAIHLTAPHGIEQYGGAAWGMRDVCQGPIEWLLARGEHATAVRILEDVFAHQYADSGAWPQWTMHPPFQSIQSPHSHGDVAVWPIIAAVNVLRATGDPSLLDRSAPFTRSEPPFALTEQMQTLRRHLDLAIDKLRGRFVPSTSLLAYGDGDWNDSLQPARPEMRESMVSSWTVALFYQALRGYAQTMRHAGDADAAHRHDATADAVRDDFNRLLVADDQIAGLYLYDDDPAEARHLLHPRDTHTGVRYRLLPMIRGIISELFTPEQAAHHASLIDQHLLAPDGARLMDRPPHYTGGTTTHFQRLESASFFGREIGLMYVHAHLRYAEAVAKLGRAEAFAEALLKVNPVGLEQSVPNAAPRQANCYFSSSDAAFLNRPDSEARYDALLRGEVPVHGGWRVYSSGPGIYLGLIVRQWLGLRGDFDRFVFDPVMTDRHDGLVARLTLLGVECAVTFRIGEERFNAVREVRLDGRALESVGRETNPYRTGGLRFDRAALAEKLRGSRGELEVDCR
ncbi:MAG: cellobiose phosphorylase [Planctomycetota bacterium]